MIKLLPLLFGFVSLFGAQSVFLLPDQKSGFLHELIPFVSRSSSHVLVITPSLEQSELKKSMLKAAKNGSRVDLIVHSLDGDALSIVQYDRINLYRYTARPLSVSAILIDERILCTLSGSFIEEQMTHHASFGRCSDDPEEIRLFRQSIQPLLKRSKAYLH